MLEHIIEGGSMMIPLLICSVVGLAVIIDRGMAFWRNKQIDTRALRADVLASLREDKLDEAVMLCANTASPVSAVLLSGLQAYAKIKNFNKTPESVRAIVGNAMEDFTLHASSAVEKRMMVLATVGNCAPLFGMCGTVTGMITSFKHLSGSSMDAGAVAAGISEALVTTAAGLLIALGAVIPYNYFFSVKNSIELEIEEAASELLDYLTTHELAMENA